VAVPSSPSKYFTFSCNWGTGATNQFFVVTATGVVATPTAGFIYTIDQDNLKTSDTPWGDGTTCWIMKKGDTC